MTAGQLFNLFAFVTISAAWIVFLVLVALANFNP
jgi:hypothetical protein